MPADLPPLHMTKIAFGVESPADLARDLAAQGEEARITTRYLPRRHAEMAGGSLYWIYEHAIVGRTPLRGFEQRDDGRWWVRLDPVLIAVQPLPRRAHQGWRYLANCDAPDDLAEGAEIGDVLPGRLLGQLAKLGLV